MVSDMESKLAALASKLSAASPDKERVALGMSFRGILGKKGTLFFGCPASCACEGWGSGV